MDNGASSYRRFLNGDESAFDEIMKELFDNLVFFINRYVHDIHAAEDIAIDTFSDLVVNKHRYNFKVTLKTYLFMLGRSRALNYIKHRKVIDFIELMEAALQLLNGAVQKLLGKIQTSLPINDIPLISQWIKKTFPAVLRMNSNSHIK